MPAPLKALLIDLSGTLHVSDAATAGAAAALQRLRAAKLPLRFGSNTSKESKGSLLRKCEKLGLDVREEELFTSLSAVRSLVDSRNLNPFYLLTPSSLSDFPPQSSTSERPYDTVVVGLAPDQLAYNGGMNEAFRLLMGESEEGKGKGKVGLVVTHKALYVGASDGRLSLGPGPFIQALEIASGVNAEVVGKPSRAFYELALRSLASDDGVDEADWDRVGMIGDDWQQDTGLVAQQLGLRRYLVQTGKYRPGDETRLEAEEGEGKRPDWCGENFAAAVEDILGER